METWVIYALFDGGSPVVRYIGFTRQPKARWRQHLSDARCGKKRAVSAWLRSVIGRGLTPEMIAVERGEGPGWKAAERKWIALHRDTLVNVSAGGNAPHNTPASRASMRAKLKGRQFTDEWRQKIAQAKRGGKRPDNAERNRAISEGNRGRKMVLTDAERARRATALKAVSAKRWPDLSPEEKARRSAAASAQMKRVWNERRANRS